MITTKQAGGRRAMALATAPARCRTEELGVIERFLAERGATRCPDPQTIAQSGQSELVWDKMKRKWVRPIPPLGMQMSARPGERGCLESRQARRIHAALAGSEACSVEPDHRRATQ
jgi:hypothetical protein